MQVIKKTVCRHTHLVRVANEQEVHFDLLEHATLDQQREEGHHELVLVLSCGVVQLQVQHRRQEATLCFHPSQVVQKDGGDKVAVLGHVVPVPVLSERTGSSENSGQVSLGKHLACMHATSLT